MKRAAKYLSTAFLVVIILVAAFTLLAPRFGWRIDTILSGSMSPDLKTGGMAVTQPVESTDIEVGDIITYGSPIDGEVVTHRVVEIREHSPPFFRTKGDANEDHDSYLVPPENVVGKVCFHIPLLGYVAQFIKTPLGFILMLFVPGFIIIVMEVRNIRQAIAENETERQYKVR